MQKRIWQMLVLMCSVLTLSAQNNVRGKVTVVINSEQKIPLENATVELIRDKDSIMSKTAITDQAGLALFDNVKAGNYRLKITALNYAMQMTELFAVSAEQLSVQVPAVFMKQQSAEIKEVVVMSRKPFIQKLSDRLVVNVENSIIGAGSSAMDVLEKSPGVTVDQNDVIGLRGRQGVVIMIDGKPTPMTGTDLANYLRGLPSNTIDRIDIITNPSARYDASGSSGIIDIHMKKDQKLGLNGTVTAGYGQGIYSKTNTGTTFNYRDKKVNFFGSYNYSYRKGLNHLILDRSFFNSGIFSGGDLKDNYITSPNNFQTARLGADFFIDKKTIIGFVASADFGKFKRNTNNNSIVIDNQHQFASTFATNALVHDNNNNSVANINFKHTFNKTGEELTADIDYGEYHSGTLSNTGTRYYKLDGTSLQPDYLLNGDQHGLLTLRTAKMDYTNTLKNQLRLEAGGKTSYVSSDNDAKFFDLSSGTPVDDINKTNHFLYEEYNNAVYLNLSKEFKKFNIQIGLRGENTHLKTHQVKGNVYFDSSYFQLFPSAFFNYKVKDDQTIGISVSRRIDRPNYSQLDPFLFLIDVSTYSTGNPALLPQLTWSYELNYTVKNLNFTLGYSHTVKTQNTVIVRFKDVFPAIPQADNVSVQIPVNLTSNDYYGLSVSAPIHIGKAWNMVNNGNLYYSHYNGNLSGTTLNNGKPAFDIQTNNTFTLGKNWVSELNVSFTSGGQYGFMVFDPQYGVSTGIQKTVLKSKGTIRLNITDIFWTNLPKAVITYTNYIEKWHAYRETRVANISFTYRFGKKTVQAARRHTIGSEEERQRAGN